jgi:WD40 repeat protein
MSAIDTDHDRVREHTQWLARALHWDSRGRDRSSLLRGRDLQAAEDWISRAGVDPSPAPLQVDLVTASRNAERRRLRSIIAIAVVTVLVTSALAVFALVQWNEAINQRNQAQSRALAAAAQSQLDIDPERSLLLASAAYAGAPTSQAVAALRTALQQSRVRVTVAAHQASVSGVVWSSDGRTVLTSARDGSLAAWDAASGQPRGRLELGPGAIERLVAARTAPIGVAMTEGGAAVLWRVEPSNGQLTRLAELADTDISDVAISDDGRVVVAAMRLEGVGVWTGDGRPAPAVPWARVDARSVALSADGATLLIGGSDRTICRAGRCRPGDRARGRPEPDPAALGRREHRPARAGRTPRLAAPGRHRPARAGPAAGLPRGARPRSPPGSGGAGRRSSGRAVRRRATGPASPPGCPGHRPRVHGGRQPGRDRPARRQHPALASDDGTSIAQLRGPTASAARLTFAPDNRRLVTGRGDGTVQVWELPAQPLRLPLSEGAYYPFEATGVDFAPDGTTVLTASGSGEARMWDPATGLEKLAGDRCRDFPAGDGCLARATVLAQLGKLTAADYSQRTG